MEPLDVEKLINREELLEAIRAAIQAEAEQRMSDSSEVVVDIDPSHEQFFLVYEIRTVVALVQDVKAEISLEDALRLAPEAVVGNRLKIPAELEDYRLIAAQTAKRVITEKIKSIKQET